MSEQEPLRSALYEKHVAAEAKMGQEAGWEVPLVFSGIAEEVRAVRSRAGVLDISHAGRIRIRGAGAVDLLERVCTADAVHQEDDTALYTLLCNERGGVIDHGHLLRLADFWVLVCSPPCRGKLLEHLQTVAADFDAQVDDQTGKTSQIAVTGPAAPELLDKVLPMKVSSLPPLAVRSGSLLIARYIAARISCSGEWGMEVILTSMMASQAWRFITQKAGESRLPPVGLAAADVLRIEAGLPRYGCELNETIDPMTAGLERCVDFDHDFIGRDAVAKIRDKATARRLVGLVLEVTPSGKPATGAIPKQGSAVKQDGVEVGAVTSATYSPTLDKIIAMAYVGRSAGEPGSRLDVTTGRGDLPAVVKALPFLSPK